MHEKHWGMTESPFQSGGYFYQTPSLEEAFARLEFLVENGRQLGILLADQGIGKSFLLAQFRQQQQQSDRFPVLVDLQGLDCDEFTWQLASQLRINPDVQAPTFVRWRQIAERLQEHRYDHMQTVVLLDNIDTCEPSARPFISRLLNVNLTDRIPITMVASSHPGRLLSLGSDFLGRAELRIELPNWIEEDTLSFLETSVRDAGRTTAIFDEAAAMRLHELTGGVPRFVCQLAELALLAGAAQQANRVDVQTVDAVFEELCITSPEPMSVAG